MAHLILAVFAVLLLYALLTLARPTRRCRRCKGKRVTRSRITRRLMPCPRCHGTGRHYRRGGTAIHRFLWLVAGERIAAQLRQRHEKGRQS